MKGLPIGFVWSPFGELQDIPRIKRSPKRCRTCGAFLGAGNGSESIINGSRSWRCSFCGRDDNNAGEVRLDIDDISDSFPELSTDTVDYQHENTAPILAGSVGSIILIVDQNLSGEEARWAREAADVIIASAAENGQRFALLTIGAGCAVSVRHAADETPVMEVMSHARASKLSKQEKHQYFLDIERYNESNRSDTDGIEKRKPPSLTKRLINSRPPVRIRQPSNEDSEEVQGDKVRPSPEDENRRLDLAIMIAFELLSGMSDAENSRILSLITGPPTYLAQQVKPSTETPKVETIENASKRDVINEVFEKIGARAGEMRIALDFLCFGGPHGFEGNLLLSASKRSRGGLVYTATHDFSSSQALADAASFLITRSTNPGVVSIRVSSPMCVARVIGPAFPTAAPHTYAVPGIDPLTGFTVILKPIEENQRMGSASPVVVQLTAKSLHATRVVTMRIPVCYDATDFLNSLDAEISAVIIGKACVVSGGALTQPSIAASSIDVSAQRLLQGSEATVGIVRLLYELRRGLLIEQQLHPDHSLILRSFFLRGECGIASLLMSPRLFTNEKIDEGSGLMGEIPLERKYVNEECVLVLDTGFNVFVYVGSKASAEAEESVSESARSVAAQRLWPCQLWKVRQGPDGDAVLNAYLSPDKSVMRGLRLSAFEKGFLPYCISLASESGTVRALLSGRSQTSYR